MSLNICHVITDVNLLYLQEHWDRLGEKGATVVSLVSFTASERLDYYWITYSAHLANKLQVCAKHPEACYLFLEFAQMDTYV